MKIAGHEKYPFGVMSPNDPSGAGLGFDTLEKAQHHVDFMNSKIPLYDVAGDTFWDNAHWKVKPEPFVVETL